MRVGSGGQLHRVAHRLHARGTIARDESEKWIASLPDLPLTSFPHLFVMLQEFALILAVERRIEA
eukprot:7132027-Pyramimonas_sp.AAC.1